MACIHFGRNQDFQSILSLWPPIGSRHKLFARHLLQDCSYRLPFSRMSMQVQLSVKPGSHIPQTYRDVVAGCN